MRNFTEEIRNTQSLLLRNSRGAPPNPSGTLYKNTAPIFAGSEGFSSEDDWHKGLEPDRQGKVKDTLDNLVLAIRYDKRGILSF